MPLEDCVRAYLNLSRSLSSTLSACSCPRWSVAPLPDGCAFLSSVTLDDKVLSQESYCAVVEGLSCGDIA